MIPNLILLQDAPAGAGMMNFVMIALLIFIFYFFMVRPQQKKQKEIKNFVRHWVPATKLSQQEAYTEK